MRYLVTFDGVDVGPLLPPQQLAGLMRTVVIPTEEALARLESEGKVHGGVAAGARAGALILDAESHDEANQILQGLPAWGIAKWELTRWMLSGFSSAREAFTAEDVELFVGPFRDPSRARAGSALYRHFIQPEVARIMTGTYLGAGD
jgi:hypothetical protein